MRVIKYDMTGFDELEGNIVSLLQAFYEEYGIDDPQYLRGMRFDDFSDYGYETGLVPAIREHILALVALQASIAFEPKYPCK